MAIKIPAQHRKLFVSMSLFALVLFPVLIGLGFWQLGRAEWRSEQWDKFQREQLSAPVEYNHTSPLKSHQRVLVEGRFLADHQYFLQNRTHEGQPGVEVIELFETEGRVIAVNRGFLMWRLSSETPSVAPASSRLLVGSIAPEDTNPTLSDENTLPWLQTRHYEDIERAIARPIDAEIRLAAEHRDVLASHWQINLMKPEKHIGYAVQWFSMAFALIILYGVLILKITTNKGEVHADSC